jgi:hypothetical protein
MAEFTTRESVERSDLDGPQFNETSSSQWPRLRLHHLFALTSVMAVMMGLSGPQYDFGPQPADVPQLLRIILVCWGLVYSLLTSIAVTIVAYGIAWKRSGARFFDQPGHWLMAEIALASLLGLLAQIAYRAARALSSNGDADASLFIVFGIGSPVIGLFRIAFNIFLGLKKCREPRWKWVFDLKALAVIVQVFVELLVLVMLSRAALIDRREGVRRDAVHRCGVSIQIALSMIAVFLTVFFMFWLSMGLWR